MCKDLNDRLKIQPRFLGSYLLGRSLEIAEAAVRETDPVAREALQDLCLATWRSGIKVIKRE